jgi:hypothetical protein
VDTKVRRRYISFFERGGMRVFQMKRHCGKSVMADEKRGNEMIFLA